MALEYVFENVSELVLKEINTVVKIVLVCFCHWDTGRVTWEGGASTGEQLLSGWLAVQVVPLLGRGPWIVKEQAKGSKSASSLSSASVPAAKFLPWIPAFASLHDYKPWAEMNLFLVKLLFSRVFCRSRRTQTRTRFQHICSANMCHNWLWIRSSRALWRQGTCKSLLICRVNYVNFQDKRRF